MSAIWKAFVRKCCCLFILCLKLWNHCLLRALWKQTYLEGSLPQQGFCVHFGGEPNLRPSHTLSTRFSNILLLLLKSNPSRQHSNALYHWGVRRRGETEKTQKGRSEEKVVCFSLASPFPARKRETVTQDGTRGIDHPKRRKTQGPGIVKGWEGKRDRRCIPDIFT